VLVACGGETSDPTDGSAGGSDDGDATAPTGVADDSSDSGPAATGDGDSSNAETVLSACAQTGADVTCDDICAAEGLTCVALGCDVATARAYMDADACEADEAQQTLTVECDASLDVTPFDDIRCCCTSG
jgi:hypothetical protein